MIHLLGADNMKSLKDDNQESFLHYTELGWEVTVGRLQLIRMLSEGKASPSDTVVTLKDRMFFYSKFCKNVIPYESPVQTNGIMPNQYGEYVFHLHVKDKAYPDWRWPQDIPRILDFDFEECSPPKCVVITHRVRGWCTNRNCDINNTRSFVSMVMDLGYKPYIGGLHAEDVDSRAEYLPTLRKVASVTHHPNCAAIIAAGGISLLSQQVCRSKLLCLMTCGEQNPWFEHPLYLSKHLNFAGAQCFLVSPNGFSKAKEIIGAAK